MGISSMLTLIALGASTSAHSIFQAGVSGYDDTLKAHQSLKEVYINGVDQGHINGIRVPSYDGVSSSPSQSFQHHTQWPS